ncbi:IDEAL domain-containing protein [Neobacillus sp. 19]|uniref:IDEAL domain-containing protein n=1 Tax=Neobacillus sp. 19 TaxID=3394458 RepID=UPI003BF73250
MKKLVCKYCGNAEFYVLNVNETLCKCGVRLTKLSDYRNAPKPNKEQKRQADAISRVSLLKREIDKCLDERDEERFNKLTYELRVHQHYLSDPKEHLKKRLETGGQTPGEVTR